MIIFNEEDLKSLPVNYLMVKKIKFKKNDKNIIRPFKYIEINNIKTNSYLVTNRLRYVSTIIQSLH